jgi:hypothetical protein
MRRLVLCGTLIVLVLASRHVSGQGLRAPADNQPAQPGHGHADHDHQHGHHHHRGQSGFWCDVSFPWFGSGGFTPAFYPYYPSYTFVGYSVLVPPVTVLNLNLVPANARAAAPAPVDNNPPVDPAPPPEPRNTNAERKARAGRYIGFGDANFGKQKYLAALDRYKTAITSAPDMAESYFRQGFALVALGQYEKAADAFRRGLRIRSNWNGSPFRLDHLYRDAPLAKTQHVENLAKAVEANPFDADLLLVLGMESFFDGHSDRAGVFFSGSARLGGNEDGLLNDFLPKADAADPPKAGGKIVF